MVLLFQRITTTHSCLHRMTFRSTISTTGVWHISRVSGYQQKNSRHMNTIETIQANLAARINRLRMAKREIYCTHTIIEVLKHKSFEVASIDAQLAALMQLFALTRGGEVAIKESTEQLNDETRRLEETFGPPPEAW